MREWEKESESKPSCSDFSSSLRTMCWCHGNSRPTPYHLPNSSYHPCNHVEWPYQSKAHHSFGDTEHWVCPPARSHVHTDKFHIHVTCHGHQLRLSAPQRCWISQKGFPKHHWKSRKSHVPVTMETPCQTGCESAVHVMVAAKTGISVFN